MRLHETLKQIRTSEFITTYKKHFSHTTAPTNLLPFSLGHAKRLPLKLDAIKDNGDNE